MSTSSEVSERPAWRARLVALGLSALTGLLLFLSGPPVRAWWLSALALVPWLVGLSLVRGSIGWGALMGGVLGLSFAVPMQVALRFPLLLGSGLMAWVALLWVGSSAAAAWATRLKGASGALALACAVTLVEFVGFTLVPVWGTAQTFVRVLSAGPWAVRFVYFTGMTGLIWAVVATQALLVALVLEALEGRRIWPTTGTVGLILVVLAAANLGLSLDGPGARLRVGAVGWTWGHLPKGLHTSPLTVFDLRYAPLVRKAAKEGASLIVSPEVAFRLSKYSREPMLKLVRDLAKHHSVMLVVGYFDLVSNTNRLAFISSKGEVLSVYTKTHLIYKAEKYRPGKGDLSVVRFDGLKIGGLICQDDNFTDLARAYGRKSVALVAVPTNDWINVKDHHLENSIFRAMENGYAVVRAASNGISAIIDSRGRVVARSDHFKEGPKAIVADVLVDHAPTFYSHVGDWPVGLCILCLVFLVWRRRHVTSS